jgi:peptide/nickel transport system ATP-binding protein
VSAVSLVEVDGLDVHYPLPRERLLGPRPKVYAVNDVDITIVPGSSLGVVGESGSGKSTLARAVMALETPTAGTVKLLGCDVHALSTDELRAHRRHFQMVFQDPYGSLDPRHKVERIVAEPLDALDRQSGLARRERVDATLASVGLKASDRDKYPHEFSGGQRQRIAIARALITRPALIVADEPVSALDVSVQAQVLNLLADLGAEFGVTYLLISHDLAVVENVCDRVAVMYLGRIVEEGPTADLFAQPAHPYTQALLDAVPRPDPARRGHIAALPGQVPSQTELPQGCGFAGRCPRAEARCHVEPPALREIAPGRRAACHFA